MKYIIAIVAAILVIGAGAFFLIGDKSSYEADVPDITDTMPVEPDNGIGDGAEPLDELPNDDVAESTEEPGIETIGSSAAGNDVTAYHFGEGEEEVLFVGGVHGGYSYNTTLLAYELIDYLETNESDLPENVSVTVIPVLNPDGLKEITGTLGRFNGDDVTQSDSERIAGRFNDNDVDLNRNFDCDWAATSMWRSTEVSGGDAPFSEPEAKALKKYVEGRDIAAAVVWFSAEGKVYPSACDSNPSSASTKLATTYGEASGYGVQAEFDAYTINGDMVNWLAKQSIPAISVLLSTHENAEWTKNQAGILAVIANTAE